MFKIYKDFSNEYFDLDDESRYRKRDEIEKKLEPYFRKVMEVMAAVLDEHEVPHSELIPCNMGYMIRFPWCDGDIVCHGYSINSEYACVESYKFPWNTDYSISEYDTEMGVSALSITQALRLIYENYLFYTGKQSEEDFKRMAQVYLNRC